MPASLGTHLLGKIESATRRTGEPIARGQRASSQSSGLSRRVRGIHAVVYGWVQDLVGRLVGPVTAGPQGSYSRPRLNATNRAWDRHRHRRILRGEVFTVRSVNKAFASLEAVTVPPNDQVLDTTKFPFAFTPRPERGRALQLGIGTDDDMHPSYGRHRRKDRFRARAPIEED